MKKIVVLFSALIIGLGVQAQQKSLPEKLGYPANTKLLIIHADDLGVSHSENSASIAALEKGPVASASIMVPCPWFPEIAAYAVAHPLADLGLHLTLTSEWKDYRWGPIVPKGHAASLLDKSGYLYPDVAGVGQNANAEDVQNELRAQIERSMQFGIKPTHLDTHMGSVAARPEFAKIYINLGREYHLPVLLTHELVTALGLTTYVTDNDVVLDKLLMATPEDYKLGMGVFYTNALKGLQPGLTMVILHAAFDNDEMKGVTVDHPDYGAAWRQADFDFFTSDKCRQLLHDQNIKVITWREIKEKLIK